MAEIKWIKITTDIFDDEKIKLIDSMPENDALIVIWFKLLTLAGKVNDNGSIYISKKMPVTDEMLATIFNRNINVVRLALKTFADFGMIDICDVVSIVNWDKHQSVDKMIEIRQKNADRQRRYRENHKKLPQPKEGENSNATVTSHNALDKIRLDKNNIYAQMFDAFWKIYPKHKDKAKALKAFTKLKPDEELFNKIIDAVNNNIKNNADWEKDNGQYVPYGSSWLNGKRWEDEISNNASAKKYKPFI